MERRLSVIIAAAGLLVAVAVFLVGGRTSADDVRAAATELEGLIREDAAAAQARADTLAQLPRLGWAVATDETTMHDLTTDELAFRPHPGEHIEITQLRRAGGEPRRLLRVPADTDFDLPVAPGTHVIVRANRVYVVTVVPVEPRQRADELDGRLAVAKEVDASALAQRLAARGIDAQLSTADGAATLAGTAPGASSAELQIALAAGPAGGAKLLASHLGRARWPRFVSASLLVAALVSAELVRRRARRSRVDAPAASVPLRQAAPPVAARPAPPAVPAATRDPPSRPVPALPPPTRDAFTRPTPLALPTLAGQSEAVPPLSDAHLEPAHSGHVDLLSPRTGSVSLDPRSRGTPSSMAPLPNDNDPWMAEYRGLFEEFVKLRRTTGEPLEGLDLRHFVALLRQKRADVMSRIPVQDVRFKLAFQNGKAAIRYVTVT